MPGKVKGGHFGSGRVYINKEDDPCWQLAQKIKKEMTDPHLLSRAAGPVRTLKEMSVREIKTLERLYGCKVKLG